MRLYGWSIRMTYEPAANVRLSVFGALLLVALVEVGLERYSYPTRFLFYLAPLLMVAIYLQIRSEKH